MQQARAGAHRGGRSRRWLAGGDPTRRGHVGRGHGPQPGRGTVGPMGRDGARGRQGRVGRARRRPDPPPGLEADDVQQPLHLRRRLAHPSSSARETTNWGPAGSVMTSRLTLREFRCTRGGPDRIRGPQDLFLRAVALPPLRPASFFCAVVPPCFEPPPLPDFFPPFFDASGELAMRAARDLDMPLSLSASYCFSFFTFADFEGMLVTYPRPGKSLLPPSS